MAEQTVWTNGNSDADLDLDANWSAGKMEAGDEVLFAASQTASATVNGDNLTALVPDLVAVAPGYSGQIGTSAEPFECSPTKIVHQGSGTLHFKDGGGTTAWMYIDSGNNTLAASIGGDTVTNLSIMRGRVEIVSGMGTIAQMFIGPGAIVDLQHTNTCTAVYANNATVTSNAAVTALYMNGGSWVQHSSGSAIALMSLYGGAKLTYLNTDTITTAIIGPGCTLDRALDQRAMTITNLLKYPTGTVLGGAQLTITNLNGSLDPWETVA